MKFHLLGMADRVLQNNSDCNRYSGNNDKIEIQTTMEQHVAISWAELSQLDRLSQIDHLRPNPLLAPSPQN